MLSKGFYHPKEWAFEDSVDNDSWEILDQKKNCPEAKGSSLIHTFTIVNILECV